ncbi:MAG: DUF2948 family protein [Robiginitomaculum sp.]
MSISHLKWLASDADDLVVMSSALQDAIAQVGDIKYDSSANTLVLVCNRFRWELPDYGKGQRVAAALRIDGVLGVKARGISRANPQALAVLLSIEFAPDADTAPGGVITLVFAGGGEMALSVEMIDVMLADISPAHRAGVRPDHDLTATSE